MKANKVQGNKGNLQNECRKAPLDKFSGSNGYTFLQVYSMLCLQKETWFVEFKTVFAFHKPACGVWMPFNF